MKFTRKKVEILVAFIGIVCCLLPILVGCFPSKDAVSMLTIDELPICVNENGVMVFSLSKKNWRLGAFENGIAPFSKITHGKEMFGYLDLDKRLVIPAKYSSAAAFHGMLASANLNGREVWINRKGKVIVDLEPGVLTVEKNLKKPLILAECSAEKMEKSAGHKRYCFLDNTGKRAFDGAYLQARPFSEGFAAVNIRSGEKKRWGYINDQGILVFRQTFDQAHSFSEGLAAVAVAKKDVDSSVNSLAFGFIDYSGTLVVPPIYEKVGDFHEGLAPVLFSREKTRGKPLWGFINKKGEVVINPTFEGAKNFAEGLAAVSSYESKNPIQTWGYINKKGVWKIAPTFSEAYDFNFGFAFVQQLNPDSLTLRSTVVDRNGRKIFAFQDNVEFSWGKDRLISVSNDRDKKSTTN